MSDAYAGARRILTLAALLLSAVPIDARPILVGAKQYLYVPPTFPESFPGQYNGSATYRWPAIDGDTLLVSATRATDTEGGSADGVHLFQRGADGVWRYVKPLEEGQPGYGLVDGSLATVQVSTNLMVFERGAQGWTQTATIVLDGNRSARRIDDGSIFIEPRRIFGQSGCVDPYEEWRKVSGTWQRVATIGPPRCDESDLADINDGRALIFHRPPGGPTPPHDVYAQNGTNAWSRVAGLTPANGYYGYYGSLAGSRAFVANEWLYRDNGTNRWTGPNRLVEPETELDISSTLPKLRGNSLVLHGDEADYALPSRDEDFPTWWGTLRIYRPRTDGYFDYFARLSANFDIADFGVSDDGTRIVAISATDNGRVSEATLLYVYELPATATFPGTQQDTFEAGNFSKWTATIGQFSVAQTAASRVLRQQSITGDAKAYLTSIDWTDQAIEADLRPTEFGGTDRWFGLATRRTDGQNYYYASFRNPNKISLRRYRNGVITELAYAFTREPFVAGKSYRVRLESVGDQHAVFVNGFPTVHAKDSAFTHGHPGVVSYRTRFDADNVIVSSGTRLLARLDTYQRAWSSGRIGLTSGTWALANEPSDDVNEDGESRAFVMRQSDTSGDAKWFSKVSLGNQVVSTRVRINRYGTTTPTQDSWAGIAAHAVDANNYYYVTLRDSNQLSLRRMINGQVQVIATVPQPVALGTWYDLRLEIIGLNIRAYVNGDLKISATDSTITGGGRNAMLTFKAAADWYHYIAYQP